MKEVKITQFSFAEVDAPKETFGFLKIPVEHKLIRAEGENLEVSDGYHTFDELYDHRITLYIALCKHIQIGDETATEYGGVEERNRVWRSSYHADGTQYEGWFILGIHKEKGKQITYHLPMSRWFETGFAGTLDRAPEFDGHTSTDVLQRIKNL